MESMSVVCRSTKPSGPDEPPFEKTPASFAPFFETEWHATQRLPTPLSSQGGLAGRPELSARGLPEPHGAEPQMPWYEPGLKTVDTWPMVRSALRSCPWLTFQK